MLVWTILGHFGPVRLPAVPRPLPSHSLLECLMSVNCQGAASSEAGEDVDDEMSPKDLRACISIESTVHLRGRTLAKIFVAESLRKLCGKFTENSFHCVRKGCGNSAESLWKFRGNLWKMFCNDPFPNDPMGEIADRSVIPPAIHRSASLCRRRVRLDDRGTAR